MIRGQESIQRADDKSFLIDFETEVKEIYESGKITAPVHLSGGNEDELIKIFEDVDEDDWVFSSWRNHYHALLHGIPRDTLMNQIVRGKSMSVYSTKPKFYSSSIVGGILYSTLSAIFLIVPLKIFPDLVFGNLLITIATLNAATGPILSLTI